MRRANLAVECTPIRRGSPANGWVAVVKPLAGTAVILRAHGATRAKALAALRASFPFEAWLDDSIEPGQFALVAIDERGTLIERVCKDRVEFLFHTTKLVLQGAPHWVRRKRPDGGSEFAGSPVEPDWGTDPPRRVGGPRRKPPSSHDQAPALILFAMAFLHHQRTITDGTGAVLRTPHGPSCLRAAFASGARGVVAICCPTPSES